MKIKSLHWKVLSHDFNKDEIIDYDIFSHAGFVEVVKSANRKFKDNESFLDEIDNALRYYFWAKAEHEILVKGLFNNDSKSQVKIDAYAQIKMNWDVFAQYLLANR